MTNFKQIINCHAHTHYSLDGAASPEDNILRDKELGATHSAITDHGNMNGALEHYKKAKDNKMKPIIGIEAYVIPPFQDELYRIIETEVDDEGKSKSPKDRESKIEKALKNEYGHLTIHFKDEWAYNYFTKLTPVMESRALVKWGERKPLITIDEIAGASGHITICTGCMMSIINKWVLPRKKSKIIRPDLAEKVYLMLREIAGKNNFFIEIMPTEIVKTWQKPVYKDKQLISKGLFVPHECTSYMPDGDIQKPSNRFAIDMANKHGDKILVSLDSHYARPEQELIQIAKLSNGDEGWRFSNKYNIITSEEAYVILNRQMGVDEKTMHQWIENSYEFASLFDNFKMSTVKDRLILPEPGENWKDKLIELIHKYGRMDWDNKEMTDRLKYELDVITNNGYKNLIQYLFIEEDVAEFCRNNNVLNSPRGSGVGSLLLYLLGISQINPLKYNLSFARFLTKGRIRTGSIADVDLDVSNQDKVIEYLKHKYKDSFARISTDQYLKLKSSIKDAERMEFGSVSKEAEDLTKSLPAPPQGADDYQFVFGYTDDAGNYHKGLFEMNPKLQEYAKNKPKVWAAVTEMLGIIRQKSSHPCGFVIADQPIQNYVPMSVINKELITGFSPKQVEMSGLIKFDFLGLNTLRDISLTLKLIETRYNKKIDIFNLPDDPKCWKAFGVGDTSGVFQFDTPTVRPYLISTKPESIGDLSNLTSLCRPGTLDALESLDENARTLSQLYVARANGEPITYIHPDLEPILKDTYGIQIYQEQTIQIFRDIGNYSEEEADEVRRGIGKKKIEILTSATNRLKEVCLAKGWREDQVNLLMSQIMASSNYGFNKSHAISYSYNAYACMWLKLNYPIEFWSSILSNASKEDLIKYWKEVNQHILLPDINNSKEEFTIVDTPTGPKIQAPLTLIDGLGPVGMKEVLSKQPFKNIDEFIMCINASALKKPIIMKLIYGNVMDSLFPEGLNDNEKIDYYLTRRSEIIGEKKSAFPQEYISVSGLRLFLLKRGIFKVYKTAIMDQAIPVLKERKLIAPSEFTDSVYAYRIIDPVNKYTNETPLIDAKTYNELILPHEYPISFGMIGYIISTKEKKFETKDTKTMKTFMTIQFEVEDLTIESVKWPKWGEDHHGLPNDLDGSIALIIFNKKPNKDSPEILKVIPIEKS